MSTPVERRIEILGERLKSRTDRDGKPLPGYASNVATIRAELAQLNLEVDGDQNDGG